MSIEELIRLTNAKIGSLTQRKIEAEKAGDIDLVYAIDIELDETQTTLAKLTQASQL